MLAVRLALPLHPSPRWIVPRFIGALLLLASVISLWPEPILAQSATVAVTPSPIPTLAPINVTSVVTSGTAGVVLPVGLTMTLHVFHYDSSGSNGMGKEYVTQNLTLASNGKLQFTPFQGQLSDICVLTTQYQGVTQGSAPVVLTDTAVSDISLPVTLYQATNDPAVLQISQDTQVIAFQSANVLNILETVAWTNNSDRLFLSKDKTADGRLLSVSLPLPVGARTVAFSSQPLSRFVLGGDANSPVISDTAPVIPKMTHQIVLSYQIPYPGGAYLDRSYPVAMAANSVQILIPDDTGVRFAGTKANPFDNAPNITINPKRPYTAHTLTMPVVAQGRVVYTLSGVPGQFTSVVTTQSTPANPPPAPLDFGIIFALIGVLTIALGLLWGLRRRALSHPRPDVR